MTEPNVWLCADCAALRGLFQENSGRFGYPSRGWCADCQEHVQSRVEWYGGEDEWRGPLVPLKPAETEDEDW